jgi:hypothetical protein
MVAVPSLTVGPRVAESMHRSVRWLDRCIEQHEKSGKKDLQNLFAIVHGALDPELRNQCLDEMIKRKDHVAGYAIGGLSGGEAKGNTPEPSACTSRTDHLFFSRNLLENVRLDLLQGFLSYNLLAPGSNSAPIDYPSTVCHRLFVFSYAILTFARSSIRNGNRLC